MACIQGHDSIKYEKLKAASHTLLVYKTTHIMHIHAANIFHCDVSSCCLVILLYPLALLPAMAEIIVVPEVSNQIWSTKSTCYYLQSAASMMMIQLVIIFQLQNVQVIAHALALSSWLHLSQENYISIRDKCKSTGVLIFRYSFSTLACLIITLVHHPSEIISFPIRTAINAFILSQDAFAYCLENITL